MRLFFIRMAVLTALYCYAAYQDIRERLISDWTWISALTTGIPLLVLDIAEGYLWSSYHLLPLTVPVYLLVLVMWRKGLFGDADAIFLAVTTFLLPAAPWPPVYRVPGILPLSVIFLASLIASAYAMGHHLVRNARMRRRGLLRYPPHVRSTLGRLLCLIMMTPVEKEMLDGFHYLPGPGLRVNAAPPDFERYSYSVCGRVYVWASVGIPLVACVCASLALHLLALLVLCPHA